MVGLNEKQSISEDLLNFMKCYAFPVMDLTLIKMNGLDSIGEQ